MRRATKGYLYFERDENTISSCEITHLVESAGMVEFTVEGTGATWNRDVPMIFNSKGDILWSTKTDEYGNNVYEKFPHKVINVTWSVEYITEE